MGAAACGGIEGPAAVPDEITWHPVGDKIAHFPDADTVSDSMRGNMQDALMYSNHDCLNRWERNRNFDLDACLREQAKQQPAADQSFSVSVQNGRVHVEFGEGTVLNYEQVAFRCDASDGCSVRERVVERGLVVSIPQGMEAPLTPSQQLSSSAQQTQPGDCHQGLVVFPGESCTYPGSSQRFVVNADGSGSLGFMTGGQGIHIGNSTINGERITFDASRQADDSWLIEAVGQ